MDGIFLVIVLVAMVGLMFLSSRRQKRGQQEAVEFRSNLKPGDEAMTGSGLVGVIDSINDDGTVVIVSQDLKSRWLADAITKRPESMRKNSDATTEQVVDDKVAVIEADAIDDAETKEGKN